LFRNRCPVCRARSRLIGIDEAFERDRRLLGELDRERRRPPWT
jgi:hypothetical protein